MAKPAPERACDVIMKGGITSGVIYPKAVTALAEKYRFRSIGGTSVGAIAAAITAAAELNREGGGFDVVEKLPERIAKHLPNLFQPAPAARPLYALLRWGVLERRFGKAFWTLLFHHGQFVLVGAMIAFTLGLFSAAIGGSLFAVVFALLVFALVTVGLSAWSVVANAKDVLEENFYGLCPGPTQEDAEGIGLSDWLAETIEEAAGRGLPDDPEELRRPLTFGDLARSGRPDAPESEPGPIQLAMMTTNLALRRPHWLPDLTKPGHPFEALYFREDEFRLVLPGWVVDWMTQGPAARPGPQAGLWHMPEPDDLPVVVATRMSLSFPVLISAVPLYAPDGSGAVRRMLFSDGGISSNFPIHFFDALLPRRPTFGISLESVSTLPGGERASLPTAERPDPWIGLVQPKGPLGFLGAVLDAMQEWQDRLQTSLPGYRERVADVYLLDDEGGLNLAMGSETLDALTKIGAEAGALLAGDRFDFDDHRWRRFLVAYARLEETLAKTAARWTGAGSGESMAEAMKRIAKDPSSFDDTDPETMRAMLERFDGLMRHVAGWDEPLASKADIPQPESALRITPKA
ncbi:patatin-like phospholipase family protein [Salinarimonas ramus]|uniref:Suppressor n=1 Tax=Salinarimonas ramus TaxID=690164 RepID=A0A917QF90_9HYPH|nr:patatin-like phospholipase family protein [Salinarimonas ramus]GGK48061.1 suppressor [Salinarimonas ramus]